MEVEEIASGSARNLCRACLATGGIFQSIFLRDETIDVNINLAEMIMEYSSVQITLGDGLPEIICISCAEKCVELYKFKRKCETTDLTLRRLFPHITKHPSFMKAEPKDNILEDPLTDPITYDVFVEQARVKVESGESESLGVEAILNDESNDSILDTIPLKLLINKSKTMKFNCVNCNMRFPKRYNLNRHLKAYCTEGVYTCHPAKKRLTPHDFNLSECDKAEITEKMKLKNDKYKHECSICKKRFMKLSNLNRHSKVHSATRSHICMKCKKTFAKIEQLNSHMNFHNGVKPHVCTICSKGFRQICTLKDHMRTHSGEKPYLCTICGKGFNQSSNLRQHMQRHSGVKGHLCSECGTGFASKGELSVHLRTHTGTKPYVCPTCERGFTRSDLLLKHKRTHTGERPYECDVCHMRFSTNGILIRHKRVHTGEKPYVCKFCGRAFSQSNDLSKHMRTHAGEKLLICEESNTQPKPSKVNTNPLLQSISSMKFF